MSGRKAVVRLPVAQTAPTEHPAAPAPFATVHSIEASRNRPTTSERASDRAHGPGTQQDSDLDPISGVMLAVGASLVLWVVIIAAISLF